MPSKSVVFDIPGVAPSTNHMYTPIARGKQIMKGTVKRYKYSAGLIAKVAAKKQGWEMTDKPVVLTLWLTPKDYRRRDVSNICKVIEDAMSGIIYADDSQVHDLHLYKMLPESPGSLKVLVELKEDV